MAVVLALLLVMSALLFPALGTCAVTGSTDVMWLGNREIVVEGALGAFFMEFGWFANLPFSVAALKLLRGRRVPIWIPAIQLPLVLSSLMPVQLLGAAETAARVCRWGPGYWLWFLAQSLVVIAAVASRPLAADRTSVPDATMGADLAVGAPEDEKR